MADAYNVMKQDVVASLRFYTMLGIVMGASEQFSTESCQCSLNEFIKDGKEWHNGNQATINKYLMSAYQSLPGEFLSQFDMKYLGGPEELRFQERAHWGRS